MSTTYKFAQEGTNEQAVPLFSGDPKVCSVLDGLPYQFPMIEAGEEAKISPADYALLKQKYLWLVERINRLEAENIDLQLTVRFYQDICLDEYA